MLNSLFFILTISEGSLPFADVDAPARSMMSNAESGRLLSVMYLSANSTAFSIASSVYVTL